MLKKWFDEWIRWLKRASQNPRVQKRAIYWWKKIEKIIMIVDYVDLNLENLQKLCPETSPNQKSPVMSIENM